MSYDIGDRLRVTCTFTNTAGTATDPTTVAITVREPDTTETTYTWAAGQVTRSAAGVFYYEIDFDAAGTWVVYWKATGTVVAASEKQYYVHASEVV